MRVLVVLLVGIAGCGGGSAPPGGGTAPSSKSSQAAAENVTLIVADTPQPKVGADPVNKSAPGSKSKTDKPPAQVAVADGVAALKKFGARTKQDKQDKIIYVHLYDTKITDAGSVHLKGLTKLKGLTLVFTKIIDAGVADLKKALPNCLIIK